MEEDVENTTCTLILRTTETTLLTEEAAVSENPESYYPVKIAEDEVRDVTAVH